MRVIAGDIGGTKTALAVFEVEGSRLHPLVRERYVSGDYQSLDEILSRFMELHDIDCRHACFGIAGPVREQRSETTNLPWRVDAPSLSSRFGFRGVSLLNDLEANAWGIGALQDEDFHVIDPGSSNASGNAAIISAGTGLGEAGLFWDGERHRPFASEGGHADFAPASDLEIALLRHLRRRYDHVSWERVVSGRGLVNIFDFLCEHRRVQPAPWLAEAMRGGDAPSAISGAALEGRCELCSEALDLFVRLYGVEAGNHALKMMATGGVLIGGGIAPKILERLTGPAFLQGFHSKGRMESLMRAMPVKVILNDQTALYGSALYAAEILAGSPA